MKEALKGAPLRKLLRLGLHTFRGLSFCVFLFMYTLFWGRGGTRGGWGRLIKVGPGLFKAKVYGLFWGPGLGLQLSRTLPETV